MKTIYHSHLRGTNGCLGFYQGLDALLSDYPEGGLAGEFFINGETKSIWIWDITEKKWSDTNHISPAPFMGMVIDPTTFSPSLGAESGCFIYVVGEKGRYEFPRLSGSDVIAVETNSAGIIMLVWDGIIWHAEFTPLSFDNTGSPIPLFQGEWSATKNYRSSDGFSDVVSYNGEYFRLKSLVEEASNLPPDESDEWELLPHYAAIANELILPEEGVISVKGIKQRLEIKDIYGDGYLMNNGKIVHTSNCLMLNEYGDIHGFIQGDRGEFMLSPNDDLAGLTLYSGINDQRKEILKVWVDFDSNFLIEGYRDEDNYRYRTLFDGFGITVTKEKIGVSRPILYNVYSITRDGLKCKLKHAGDILESGELYYDDDGIVHYHE